MKVNVCNPLGRVPLALIVDDSCPMLNLGPYWIEQRAAWRQRHHPGTPPEDWEGDPSRVAAQPRAIPATFARRWGEWCAEQGVKGKFSMIPIPAGVGRIDQRLEGFSQADLEEWLAVGREVISPNFDLTPEMLTHTAVWDIVKGRATEEWEQAEWVDPPPEKLTEYIAHALQILKNVGIRAEGVTSPGAFARKQENAYARATLEASRAVNSNAQPFYFLWHKRDEWPDVPLWHVDKQAGAAVASIVSCAGDWFGGWTGYDGEGHADQFITEDLHGGRLPEVLERGLPCILVGHWPGFYFGGQEVGFEVLKQVKRRLDALDSDSTRTLWMKTSEIAHHQMARDLCGITAPDGPPSQHETVRIKTRFPCKYFTLDMDARLRRVAVNGAELREVKSKCDFREGTFWVDGARTFVAFDLAQGQTEARCERA